MTLVPRCNSIQRVSVIVITAGGGFILVAMNQILFSLVIYQSAVEVSILLGQKLLISFSAWGEVPALRRVYIRFYIYIYR